MIVEENHCCGCAVPAYPCLGDSCILRHCRVLYCDNCHEEADKLYQLDGEELCESCVLERLEIVE